jgi:hypothetical protein
MTYLIDTWYVESNEGTLEPVANLATGKYLVSNGYAVRLIDMTREVLSR